MDMSKSSEARIKEAVNILKVIEQLAESGVEKNYQKASFITYGINTKTKNPHMYWADENEVRFVPHMLTHQEYKYMMEHIEELMDEETSEEQNSEIPVPHSPGGEEIPTV